MHLYLTGFMGSGKTTTGQILAERLGWDFVDLDELIEMRAGMRVSEIFDRLGEPEFRRMEELALREISDSESTVVATGGGTLIEPRNRRFVRERGVTVWLDIPLSALMERIGRLNSEARPLFGDMESVAKLYQDRLPAYEASDLHVEIEPEWGVERVVEIVRRLLETRRCDT